MNKEQFIRILLLIHKSKIVLYIGLAILFYGLGATNQAGHDVIALNQSLYNISQSNHILTDGTTYYYVGLYENKINFSSMNLLNRSQCNTLYGDNK